MPVPDSAIARSPVRNANAGGRRTGGVHTTAQTSTKRVGQNDSNVGVALDREEPMHKPVGEVEKGASTFGKVWFMHSGAKRARINMLIGMRGACALTCLLEFRAGARGSEDAHPCH